MIQKFGEMPYGTWFKELNGGRVFVKMQNILPSGIQVVYESVCAKDAFYGNGQLMEKAGTRFGSYVNAVDMDGIPGCCPDWVEFEVIDPPFKQFIKHTQGANLNLPRHRSEMEKP